MFPAVKLDINATSSAGRKGDCMTNRYRWKAELIRVIDGDTVQAWIELDFGVKVKTTIRLEGVDAPEIHTTKKNDDEYKRGMEAKGFVESTFSRLGDKFTVESDGEQLDKYGRILCNILLSNGEWLDVLLVKHGLATAKEY
jgi:endonuclease YncB( thermonuclease family)